MAERLTDSEIRDTLLTFGIPVTPALCDAIRAYVALLLFWNKKIALTSVKDPREIIRFHFGESMFAAKCLPIENGRLADFGAGAGFPSIPIQIISSGLQVTLIESNAKKAAFLAEVVRKLHLDAEVFNGRAEEMSRLANRFDYVTSRAVGDPQNLIRWAEDHIRNNGKAIFWVGETDLPLFMTPVGPWDWSAPVRIPGSKHRMILSGAYVGNFGSDTA
jgi:16S rRNA (guanine527-N7)-methyltransferase